MELPHAFSTSLLIDPHSYLSMNCDNWILVFIITDAYVSSSIAIHNNRLSRAGATFLLTSTDHIAITSSRETSLRIETRKE
jgi:hypothetical protein